MYREDGCVSVNTSGIRHCDLTNTSVSKMNDNIIPHISLTASSPSHPSHSALLQHLRHALYDVGFLYLADHGIPQSTIDGLTSKLPALFALDSQEKKRLSKLNSPHFLGYSGFAEEVTLGKRDLREQFDFASEVACVWEGSTGSSRESAGDGSSTSDGGRDFSKLYWRLRGPNQWPREEDVPGFRRAFEALVFISTSCEL